MILRVRWMIRIPTYIIQWIISWIIRGSKIMIIMLSTSVGNRKNFPVCPLGVWHAQGRGSSRTIGFESTHGGKTQRTPFTRTWIGQRLDHYCGHKVVLPRDPQSSPSQPPEGPRSGLALVIRPRFGAINCAPE